MTCDLPISMNYLFAAFELCPLDSLKVVILGQDPYHGPCQAHGLSFSVPEGIAIPGSLRNMIKEAAAGQKIRKSGHGNLEKWAQQGVLLLNTTLTVRKASANSHQKQSGWTTFTDHVIKTISDRKEGVVFLLWGKHAQSKGEFVDKKRHCVLETSHPSGLSCYRGFTGSNCFGKANEYLKERGEKQINWSV